MAEIFAGNKEARHDAESDERKPQSPVWLRRQAAEPEGPDPAIDERNKAKQSCSRQDINIGVHGIARCSGRADCVLRDKRLGSRTMSHPEIVLQCPESSLESLPPETLDRSQIVVHSVEGKENTDPHNQE